MEKFDVAVVGAGISGSATALALARTGASVIILDRFGPAAMASGWTLAGVRQSGRDPAELPMAMAAVKIWQTLHEELGAPTRYVQHGNLRLARDAAEYEQIQNMVRQQTDNGLDLTFLPDNAAIREIAPAISSAIPGASFCASDGHADPQATSAAYIGALERLGVTLAMGEAVDAIAISGGRVAGLRTAARRIAADGVVLTAGLFTNSLLEPLGLSVPLETPMVAVVRTTPVAPILEQVIGVAGGDWAGRQETDGRLRLTSGALPWNGTMETVVTADGPRPKTRPPLSSLRAIIEKAELLLPGLSDAAIEDCWSGLLDLTPDALPVLDHAPGIDGLVVGMGFSGHGFCLGPVTGQVLCDLATGNAPAFDLSAFGFDRFSGIHTKAGLALHG